MTDRSLITNDLRPPAHPPKNVVQSNASSPAVRCYLDGLLISIVHLSLYLVLLRIEEYGEHFFLCISLFYHISKERHTHVLRENLSPFLASLPLLYSASSAPALMFLLSGRSCARSRHSSCPPSGDSSLLGSTCRPRTRGSVRKGLFIYDGISRVKNSEYRRGATSHRWEDSWNDGTGRRSDPTRETSEPALRTSSTGVEATPRRARGSSWECEYGVPY